MKKHISICALSLMSIFVVASQGVAATIDLRTFSAIGGGVATGGTPDANPAGAWVVNSTGTFVTQTTDPYPAAGFVTPDAYINTRFTGTFEVNGLASHDVTHMDTVGLIFGAHNDGSVQHGYVFDWRGYPDRASAGITISEYTGSNVDWWSHTGSDINILYSDVNTQTDPAASNFKGFDRYHTYNYALDYNYDGFKLTIDGQSIFNYSGALEAGKFGFFDLSQENVVFSAPNVSAVPVPASLFLLAPGLVGIVGARRKKTA